MKQKIAYCFLISIILITSFIYSGNLYNGLISAKQIWFYGAMALLILIFGIDLLLQTKNVSFRFNILDISLLVFYAYFLIRTALTPYTPLIYNSRLVNYTLLLIFYGIIKSVASRPDLNKNKLGSINVENRGEIISTSEVLVLVLISTGLIQAIWGLLQLYGITRSFHSGYKITGTFINPAPYALYLAAIFPLALAKFLTIKEYKNEIIIESKNLGKPHFYSRIFLSISSFISSSLNYKTPYILIQKLTWYVAFFAVISIILVLPATMNRASWIGIAASSLFILNYRYNLFVRTKAYLHYKTRKIFAFAIISLIIVCLGAGLYFLKKGSSDGRLLIWQVTINKIAEKPFFGHGVGRFEAEYNNWQAEYFKTNPSEMEGLNGMVAGNTKYCFNEYFELGSETGIVGLFLFIGFIGITVYIGFRKLRSNIAESSRYFLSLLSAFISLVVMALVSFPFYSLPTFIIFFLLLAILSTHIEAINISDKFFYLSNTRIFTSSPTTQSHNISTFKLSHNSNISSFHHTINRLLSFSTLLSISSLLLLLTFRQYKAYYFFDESVILYQTGSYAEACNSFSEIYIPLRYNGSYLQYYGKALNMNKEFQQSIELQERAMLFTSDEILYTTLGDSYKADKRYSKAEEAYLHASFMVPHKLYSLYLLAILYDETDQREKAVAVAGKVLNKEIKVESEATEEIRLKMRSIIEKEK